MGQSNGFSSAIAEISVKNFKGIKECKINDLSKINLFIGKNGCGKSSIMEAAYYTGKEFSLGNSLPECIERRANRGKWSAREFWYGYQVGSDIEIRLEHKNNNFAEMIIQFREENNDLLALFTWGTSRNSWNGPIQLSRYTTNLRAVALAPRDTLGAPFATAEVMEYFRNSRYIDPTIKTHIPEIEGKYLNRIELLEENKNEMAERTANIYGTQPSWGFLPHIDFPFNEPSRFTILEGGKRIFIDNFGDGLHYGLAVLAALKTRRNTAVFIEEIESHQHPEAIKNLVANIASIAQANNIQLFMTTHNRFVWNCLEKEFPTEDEREKALRVYCVLKDKNSGAVECVAQTKENADEFWSSIDKELYG